MNTSLLRSSAIILLAIISFYGVYDVFGVDVWAAVIAAYMLTYFPISAALFIASNHSKKRDTGWQKKLGILGMYAVMVSVVINVLYFISDTIRYYMELP